MLYILISPHCKLVYAGFKENVVLRRNNHFWGINTRTYKNLIPAEEAIRALRNIPVCAPSAAWFILPVVAITGNRQQGLEVEKNLLSNFHFMLNTPHVWTHVSAETRKRCWDLSDKKGITHLELAAAPYKKGQYLVYQRVLKRNRNQH